MTHIEEHILERYVVDPDSLASSAAAIERHLAACHGCRETVARIRTFYASLEQRLSDVTSEIIDERTSLIAVEERIATTTAIDLQPFEEIPRSFLSNFEITVRKHPLAAGGSAISLVGLLSLIIFNLMPISSDQLPVDFRANVEKGVIEVRNKEQDVLWKLAFENIYSIIGPDQNGEDKVALEDVDLDGRKELITAALLAGRSTPEQNKLYVFNYDGTERFSYIPEETFVFRNRTYTELFYPRAVEVLSYPSRKNIIILSSTNGRSPTRISFLDPDGNVLGEYSHFGNLTSMFTDTLEDGRQMLFLNGTCDILEFTTSSSRNYAVTIVLDPLKIFEESESNHTRGSGLPASTAEVYYIRYPWSDIDTHFDNVRTGAYRGNRSRKGFIILAKSSCDSLGWDFDYTFDRSMTVTTVKSSDATYHIHKKLKNDGYLRSTIDSSYLANLKNGVEYWDGQQWQKTPSMIKH